MYNFPVRSNNSYHALRERTTTARRCCPTAAGHFVQTGFPAPDPVVVPSNGIITNVNPTTAQFYIPKNYKNGYIESWNFAVQRQLPFNLQLDVAYVGSHGVDTSGISESQRRPDHRRRQRRAAVLREVRYHRRGNSIFRGILLELQFAAGEVRPAIRQGPEHDDGVHLAEGDGFPERRRRRARFLRRPGHRAELRPRGFRPHAELHSELRLQIAVRSRRALPGPQRGWARSSAVGRFRAFSPLAPVRRLPSPAATL